MILSTKQSLCSYQIFLVRTEITKLSSKPWMNFLQSKLTIPGNFVEFSVCTLQILYRQYATKGNDVFSSSELLWSYRLGWRPRKNSSNGCVTWPSQRCLVMETRTKAGNTHCAPYVQQTAELLRQCPRHQSGNQAPRGGCILLQRSERPLSVCTKIALRDTPRKREGQHCDLSGMWTSKLLTASNYFWF